MLTEYIQIGTPIRTYPAKYFCLKIETKGNHFIDYQRSIVDYLTKNTPGVYLDGACNPNAVNLIKMIEKRHLKAFAAKFTNVPIGSMCNLSS